MEPKLWELSEALQDAHEALARAGQLAADISGASPGRDADLEHGIPAEEADEGWPLMNQLSGALDNLNVRLQLLRSDEQLVKAIADESAADDEWEARADGASY